MKQPQPTPRHPEATTGNLAAIPEPPEWLGDNARPVYFSAANDLLSRGMLRGADLDLIAQYAAAVSLSSSTYTRMRKEGHLYTDKNGQARRHPAFTMWRSSVETANKLSKELCISPYSRARTPGDPDGSGGAEKQRIEAEIRAKWPALADEILKGVYDPVYRLKKGKNQYAGQVAEAYAARLAGDEFWKIHLPAQKDKKNG